MSKLKSLKNLIYPTLSLVLFVLVWWLISLAVGVEMVLPSPWAAFASLFSLLGTAPFWQALGGTLWRTLVSFAVSFVLALLLSIPSYLWRPFYKVLSPIVVIARAMPTMSIILLAMIWLTANLSPMLIAGLIVFPLLYAGFYSALEGIPQEQIMLAKVYQVPTKTQITTCYIPSILPTVFSVSKSSISLCVKVLIAAEVMAQTKNSMGNAMQLSKIYLNTAELLAWTIAAIVLSYLLEFLVQGIRRLVLRWEHD